MTTLNTNSKSSAKPKEIMVKIQRRSSSALCNIATTLIVAGFVFFAAYGGVGVVWNLMSQTPPKTIKALTWNMAAVNNNPFGKAMFF